MSERRPPQGAWQPAVPWAPPPIANPAPEWGEVARAAAPDAPVAWQQPPAGFYPAGAWPQQPPAGAWPGPGAYPGWNPGGYVPSPNAYPGWNTYGYGYYAPPPPGPIAGLAWGGIATRFGALLLDGAIQFGVLVLIGIVFSSTGASNDYAYDNPDAGLMTAVSAVWWLLVLVYHPACWYFAGASLGQRALGLRVVRASDGLRLGLGASLVRFGVFLVSTALVVPGLINAITASNDPFKRAWHDHAARSAVVHRTW